MFEFQWHLPGPSPAQVTLRIHSRSGWLGRKTLICDGQTVFRRGPLAGVESRFLAPGGGRPLELHAVQVSNSPGWRPALFADGRELLELTGTAAPAIVPRPRPIVIAVGLTYLAMLMALVTLPSIAKILDALHRRSDARQLVFVITNPAVTQPGLLLEQANLPPATVGRPYSYQLQARGGTPPYTWAREGQNWPKGLKLTARDGWLTYTPAPGATRDVAVAVRISDADGQTATCSLAFTVRPVQPRRADYPAIETMQLPPGVVGEPYEFTLCATGGTPPYHWAALADKLPAGLKLDARSGTLSGMPRAASDQAIRILATDSSYAYTPAQDIVPWLIPALVTAVCMLGYSSMRRWSVPAYGGLIVLQVVLGAVHVLPISITAMVVQGVTWLTGVPYVRRMR